MSVPSAALWQSTRLRDEPVTANGLRGGQAGFRRVRADQHFLSHDQATPASLGPGLRMVSGTAMCAVRPVSVALRRRRHPCFVTAQNAMTMRSDATLGLRPPGQHIQFGQRGAWRSIAEEHTASFRGARIMVQMEDQYTGQSRLLQCAAMAVQGGFHAADRLALSCGGTQDRRTSQLLPVCGDVCW